MVNTSTDRNFIYAYYLFFFPIFANINAQIPNATIRAIIPIIHPWVVVRANSICIFLLFNRPFLLL